MFDLHDLEYVLRLVRCFLAPTPQCPSALLAASADWEVWLKHENHLLTGAFKVLG